MNLIQTSDPVLICQSEASVPRIRASPTLTVFTERGMDASLNLNGSLAAKRRLQTQSDRLNMEPYGRSPENFNSYYFPVETSLAESLFDDFKPQYTFVADHDMFEYTGQHFGTSIGQYAVEYPDAFIQPTVDTQPVMSMSQAMQVTRPPHPKVLPLQPSQEWRRPSIFTHGNSSESLSSDTSGGSAAELSPFHRQLLDPGTAHQQSRHADVPSVDGTSNNMMPPFSAPEG